MVFSGDCQMDGCMCIFMIASDIGEVPFIAFQYVRSFLDIGLKKRDDLVLRIIVS